MLTLDRKELVAVLNHSGHIVQLQGAVNESALIKEVQFDPVEDRILHVDLFRVDAGEQIEVTLEVVLKGTAKGSLSGGIVNHLVHEVVIRCPASAVPERLELKIGELDVNHSLRASDLTLPEGATLVGSPDQVLVVCNMPVVETPEAAAAAATGAEPEVIARKKAEDAE